jgi:tRNA(His) 5'-end guanylyltransferase
MKEFKSLKEKCEYYRSSTNYRLNKDEYVIIMLDGRSFSKKIKNKFNKPFDEWFTQSMDLTTKYLCANVQGCKIGYCQSDEISLLLVDYKKLNSDAWFGFAKCWLADFRNRACTWC